MITEDRKCEYIDLLNRKLETLRDIYIATKKTDLSDVSEEAAAEAYIDMVEDRQELIERLFSIDEELNLFIFDGIKEEPDEEFDNEVRLLNSSIKETISQTIAADDILKADAPKIVSKLKENYRKLTLAKNVRSVYHNEAYYDSVTNRGFDKSN